MSHVVIASPVGVELIEGLQSIGLKVSSPERTLSPDQLSHEIEDATILIVRDTPVLRGAIERASSLALIVRLGHGPGRIDLGAASDRGVVVAHTPDFDAQARATRLMTLVGMLDAGIGVTDTTTDTTRCRGRGLGQSVMGIAGTDAASMKVAAAAAAIGMRVRIWGPTLTAARASEVAAGYVSSFDALIAQSNVLCLMEPNTKLSAARVAALPVGAHLLLGNPIQAEVTALAKRLGAGTLKVGALHDALTADESSELRDTGLALCLTAEALDTDQSRRNAALMVTQSVREMLRHQPASYALNLAAADPESTTLIVRHETDADCIASLFSQLRDAGLRLSDIDNRVFSGGRAAVTRIRLNAPPSPVLMQRLQGGRGVIAVDALTP